MSPRNVVIVAVISLALWAVLIAGFMFLSGVFDKALGRLL